MTYPTTPGYVAGSDTSEDAASAVNAATLRTRTRTPLAASPLGLTSDELEVITGWPHQTASARLRELVLAGEAVDTDERRLTRHGRRAVVRRHCDQGGEAASDGALF